MFNKGGSTGYKGGKNRYKGGSTSNKDAEILNKDGTTIYKVAEILSREKSHTSRTRVPPTGRVPVPQGGIIQELTSFIERAKEILSSLDFNKHTIDTVAEKAGFNSKSPFYLAFKKHTGMTPKEFISVNNK